MGALPPEPAVEPPDEIEPPTPPEPEPIAEPPVEEEPPTPPDPEPAPQPEVPEPPTPEPAPAQPETLSPAEPDRTVATSRARAYLAAHDESGERVDIFRKKETPPPPETEAAPATSAGWIMAALCLWMLILGWMAYARLSGRIEALADRITKLEAGQSDLDKR